MTLRETIGNLMVNVHQVTPELAGEWVAEMDHEELRRRFQMYTGFRPASHVAKGAIGNLTINGMGARAGILPMPVVESFPGVSRNVGRALTAGDERVDLAGNFPAV